MGTTVDNIIITHLNLTLLTDPTVDTMIVIYLYPMLSTGPDEYDSNTPISLLRPFFYFNISIIQNVCLKPVSFILIT